MVYLDFLTLSILIEKVTNKKNMKITLKYEIVLGEEVVECESLNDAEKKLKNLKSSETECYLVRKEFKGDNLIEEFYVG